MVSEAWLGHGYPMIAQVNVVPSGGSAAQAPNRDYHLGFQLHEEVVKFPLHAQTMSAKLTLQGADAHVDIPIESGPTKLLPFSQQYKLGYQIYRQDDFKVYFE
jgi:ectoine hydroxylase-related dioxygenase (phytanoyl-CoA dioxygenase family)